MLSFLTYLKEYLLVARKMKGKNGAPDKIKVGKPGDLHSDLLTTREYDNYWDGPGDSNIENSMGFVHHKKPKKFMTRKQALTWMKKKDERNLRQTKRQERVGLHSNQIKKQS